MPFGQDLGLDLREPDGGAVTPPNLILEEIVESNF
jgi:hypothetical protein